MTGIFKINNNEVFGSDGTFSGTISSGATFPGPPSGADGGHILQVVSVTTSAYFSQAFASSGATDWVTPTGLTLNITPSSTSNKILVIGNISLGGAIDSDRVARYRVTDNSSITYSGDAHQSRTRSLGGFYSSTSTAYNFRSLFNMPFNYLYSPNSTSQQTYAVQIFAYNSTTLYVNASSESTIGQGSTGASTITAMEIKA